MATSLPQVNKDFVNNLKNGKYKGNMLRDNIRDSIQMQIMSHNIIISTFDKFDSSDAQVNVYEAIQKRLKDKTSKGEGVSIYKKYITGLEGAAAAAEKKKPLSTVLKTSELFVTILESASKELNNILTEKTVNVHSMKLSQAILIGVLEESKLVAKASNYMLGFILNDFIAVINKQPKYKTIFLYANVKNYSSIVSKIFLKSGAYAFLQNIKKLKSTNTDILLLNDKDQSNLKYVENDKMSNVKGLSEYINYFVAVPNPFRWFGGVVNRIQNTIYKHRVSEREYLEAQIELYKLQLSGASKDDPESIKLQKVIKIYEDELSRISRDIEKYETE